MIAQQVSAAPTYGPSASWCTDADRLELGSLWGASTLADCREIVLEPPPVASVRAGDRARSAARLRRLVLRVWISMRKALPPRGRGGGRVGADPAHPPPQPTVPPHPQCLPIRRPSRSRHACPSAHASPGAQAIDPQLVAWRGIATLSCTPRLMRACTCVQPVPADVSGDARLRDAVLTLRDARFGGRGHAGDTLRKRWSGPHRARCTELTAARVSRCHSLEAVQWPRRRNGARLDGFWGTPARASLGDPHFENRSTCRFPPCKKATWPCHSHCDSC